MRSSTGSRRGTEPGSSVVATFGVYPGHCTSFRSSDPLEPDATPGSSNHWLKADRSAGIRLELRLYPTFDLYALSLQVFN
jgi:hypothetical protein